MSLQHAPLALARHIAQHLPHDIGGYALKGLIPMFALKGFEISRRCALQALKLRATLDPLRIVCIHRLGKTERHGVTEQVLAIAPQLLGQDAALLVQGRVELRLAAFAQAKSSAAELREHAKCRSRPRGVLGRPTHAGLRLL
ncbi:MAG: hypothetical protein O9341_03600, partial [Paucibacter sp.]|nr:hypothetical protein [Roseateles sp.]